MKIGVTVWQNRISPLFDSAQLLWLCALESDAIKNIEHRRLQTVLPGPRAEELSAAGIDVLICGAISLPYTRAIEGRGIQIVPFISGNVQHVLDAYIQNKLNQPQFFMPGCGYRRRYRLRGGRF